MNWKNLLRKWRKPVVYHNIIPLYLQYAIKEIGVAEVPGEESNPRIDEYLKTCNLKDDKIGWCSAFLCWIMMMAGLKHTGSALARSWLQWGVPVEEPKPGDIAIFKRGTKSWQGHCAIYMDSKNGLITVLGGNQSNSVSISRYPENKLLGYRRASI